MIKGITSEECTGCFACYNICPKNCIIMKEQLDGFKQPEVIQEKCINCGLCQKVCPIQNKVDFLNNETEPVVIAAQNSNIEVRVDSTSGGVFSALAYEVLEAGGYVAGAIYNEEWLVEHIITNRKEDVEKLRSSKYLQSNMNNLHNEIKEKLNTGKLVLVCGAPCQINSIYKFLGKDYENLITCDFICKGVNSPKIFKKYIKSLEKKYSSKVKSIKFKEKSKGWHNFSTKITFENHKKYLKSRYFDSFMVGYLEYNAFIRESCYQCKFKESPRNADITLADFWGIENVDINLDDDKGTSMLLLNSKKGEIFFNNNSSLFKFKKITNTENIFKENQHIDKPVVKTQIREKVMQNIDKKTYNELSKEFFPLPNIFKRFIRVNKNVIKKIYRNLKKG